MLGFCGVLAWCSLASASGPPLLLGITDCGELNEHEVRRLVVAELGAIPVEQQAPEVTLVAVRCGGLRVTIRVHDPLSRKDVERSFNAAPLDPRARARWVALAAAELVLSSWAELELNPAPRTEPEGPAPPATARDAAAAAVRKRAAAPAAVTLASGKPAPTPDLTSTGRRTDGTEVEPDPGRTFRTVVMGSARSFLEKEGFLYGGGVRISEERFRYMSWSADLLFEAGTVSSGSVNYDIRSGTLGAWLMLYGRAGPRALVTGRAGVGLRVGLIGSQADVGGRASNALAPWGWPMAALSTTVGRAFVVELSVEAGYVVLPVGGAATGSSVRGPWACVQLGFGAGFDATALERRRSAR